MSGKSRRSEILVFPDCPRFGRLMKTLNRRNPWSSGMEGEKCAAFLFSRRLPDFCVGRRWFPTNENSNIYRRDVGAKLLGSGLPIIHLCTNLIFFGAFSISRQIQYLEKLGQYGRDPFNQNSNRSDREKWSTSKGGPVFSKLFRLDRTDPLSLDRNFRKF